MVDRWAQSGIWTEDHFDRRDCLRSWRILSAPLRWKGNLSYRHRYVTRVRSIICLLMRVAAVRMARMAHKRSFGRLVPGNEPRIRSASLVLSHAFSVSLFLPISLFDSPWCSSMSVFFDPCPCILFIFTIFTSLSSLASNWWWKRGVLGISVRLKRMKNYSGGDRVEIKVRNVVKEIINFYISNGRR